MSRARRFNWSVAWEFGVPALFLCAVGLILFGLWGCTPTASSRTTPATVDYRSETTTVGEDGKPVKQTVVATARSSAQETRGDNVDNQIEQSAPTLALPNGATISAGDTSANANAKGKAQGPVILYSLGALFFAAGVVCIFLGWSMLLGVGLCVAGVGLAAVGYFMETAPWVIYLGGLAAVVAVGLFLWQTFKGKKTGEALTTVISAVEDVKKVNPSAGAEITRTVERIASEAGRVVRPAISTVKAKLKRAAGGG